MSAQAILIGFLAAIIGFVGSFAVVLQGLTALGANEAEAASGLAATSLAMGLMTIVLSFRTRMPISIVWSTPGAALLAASGHPASGLAAGIGVVFLVGILLTAAGLWSQFGRWMTAVPPGLANGMLAGILFDLCLAPVRAVVAVPLAALAVLGAWLIVARIRRLYAVPAAAMVAILWVVLAHAGTVGETASIWPRFELHAPSFSVAATVGLAFPLFIVTMASQNLPGLAVLTANGYRPEAGKVFVATGIATMVIAPVGGVPLNLAALTAALCAGSDAHDDPARRYWATIAAGSLYLVLGLTAAIVTLFVSYSPLLIQEVAGLALLGAFSGALLNALSTASEREAATITFLTAASGVAIFGIGAAFWGLLAGGTVLLLQRRQLGTPA